MQRLRQRQLPGYPIRFDDKFAYVQDAMGRISNVTKTGELFDIYDAATTHGLKTSYTYDSLSQLKSETSVDLAGSPANIAGRQDSDYSYDTIGNRTSVTHNGQTATYTADDRNRYTQRTVPGYFDVAGAVPGSTVTVTEHGVGNPQTASRNGSYFFNAYPLTNTGNAVYTQLDLTDNSSPANTGNTKAYVPKTAEAFGYDDDGNLTGDGRWTYAYDAENRLIQMETDTTKMPSGLPRQKLVFTYDYLGRRAGKTVQNWNTGTSSYDSPYESLRFIYNGWNLMAELDHLASDAVVRSFYWGLDLSGSQQGAGGVGGLLMTQEGSNTYLLAYDAMGNVHAMMTAANVTLGGTNYVAGDIVAAYEYDAFGNNLRESGPYAASNPFRFATKYTDIETGLIYHDTRYYSPSLGRFITRDSIGEQGGLNLYAYVSNRVPNAWDYLGMDPIDDWDLVANRWEDTATFDPPGMYDDPRMDARESHGAGNLLSNGVADFSGGWGFGSRDQSKLNEIQAKLDAGKNVTVVDAAGNVVTLTPGSLTTFQNSNGESAIVGNFAPSGAVREYGGFDQGLETGGSGLIVTRAGIEVNRIGFRDFDSKVKAAVDFIGALEKTGIGFDMMPTGTPSTFQEAVEFWATAVQYVGEKSEVIPSPTNYASAVSAAFDRLNNTLGRTGPFEARTVIDYKQLETRPFLIFWTQQTWVPYTKIEDVRGPLPGGLFTSVRAATDEASRVLVDRVKNLGSNNGGLGR
ncbi:MAG: RHS repeat-associated core domain-containing protein [Opitutaceae bacterium]|nr:RHS repeat-associated core domain-containing protein [Opitutaceae bacterium]